MAEIIDFAKLDAADAADARYKANPDSLFARLDQADAKGVTLNTEAPVGQPGFLGGLADVGRGLAKGTISTLPSQLGQAAEFFGAPETGKRLQAFADEQAKAHPQLEQSQVGQIANADNLSVRGGAYGAGENTPLSHGPALAGAATGAALGALGGPAGALAGAGVGYVVGSLGALPIFYGSQAQQTKEDIQKGLRAKGVPEAEVERQSNLGGHFSGAVEAGGELLADLIPFHALFNPLGKAVKGELVKSTLGNVGRKIAANVAGTVTAEVSTEMAQQALEDEIGKRYGAEGEGANWKSTLSVVVPTALMTLIPGGFTAAHTFRSNLQVRGALANPEADPEQRAAATALVFHSIKDADPLGALAFDVYATNRIAEKQPIEIKDDAAYKEEWTHYLQHPEDSVVDPTTGLRPQPKPSEQAGLDPNAGPVSAAAAAAVDSGASAQAQGEREQEAAQAGQETPAAPNPNQEFTMEEAAAQRDQLQAATGQEHRLVPSLTAHDKFTVQPTGNPAPVTEQQVGEAAKAGDEALKAQEQQRKEAYADLDRRLKLFRDEAKAVETKAKASAGEGEPQMPPEFKALVVASSAHWDPTAATRALKTAIELGRQDIVLAIVERAQRVADEAASAKTVIPPGSPLYAGATKAIARTADAARTVADKLAAMSQLGGENAVQVTGAGGVLPHAPEGVGGAGGERVGVGQGIEGTPPTEAGGADRGGQPAGGGAVTGGPQTPPVVGPGENQQGNPPNVAGPQTPATGETGKAQGPVTPPGYETAGGTATGPQIEAENFKKPRHVVAGFPVAAENYEGQARRSKPSVEPPWETKIQKAHYGHFDIGQPAADSTPQKKQKVDVFWKPGTTEDHDGPVFVIDQPTKEGGFDEHKVMLGYASQMEAIAAYKANYPAGWKVGPVTQTTNEGLRSWLDSGNTKRPFAERTADPLDQLVDYDKIEETDDSQPTGRYAKGKVPARDALKDIDERLAFAKAMRECLGI